MLLEIELLLDTGDSTTNDGPTKWPISENLKLERALEAKAVNHDILLKGDFSVTATFTKYLTIELKSTCVGSQEITVAYETPMCTPVTQAMPDKINIKLAARVVLADLFACFSIFCSKEQKQSVLHLFENVNRIKFHRLRRNSATMVPLFSE